MTSTGPAEAELAVVDLRVDVDGVPACDGLSFQARGRRVLVLGAPRALFDATTGLLPAVRGAVTIRGASANEAASRRLIAGAAMEPPMPPRWTVLEYVSWSARLSGLSASEARKTAHEALDRMQLGAMAKSPIVRLLPHARRATVVASALATGAPVIALDDPLGGLPDDVAAAYADVLVTALEDRTWFVFAPRASLTAPLGVAADEVLVCTATQLEMQGAPTELLARARCFVGRVLGSVSARAAVAPALEVRGARMEERGAHLFFDLGESLTTSELMEICASADVAVVELVPAIRALS